MKFERESLRTGKNPADWFYRAFNATGIYETFLKSTPMYFGFMVMGGILGGWMWGGACENYWIYVNKGRLYADCPYVYPAEED